VTPRRPGLHSVQVTDPHPHPHPQDGTLGCSEPLPVHGRHRQRHEQAAGGTAECPAIGWGAGVSGSQSPARYEIRVGGVLDQRWTACFEGLQVTSESSQTVISGPLPDQPALHGALLIKVRDLGMCLISVRRLDPDQAGQASPP
jgi:hypothetical protein